MSLLHKTTTTTTTVFNSDIMTHLVLSRAVRLSESRWVLMASFRDGSMESTACAPHTCTHAHTQSF